MKKFTLFFALVLSNIIASAQFNILSVTTYPVQPNDADTTYLIVSLAFPSGDCELDHIQVGSPDPEVFLYHCLGMLTVICYQTDTVNLGILPAGPYQIPIHVLSGNQAGPGVCANFIETEVSTHLLTVDLANKINELKNDQPLIHYNPLSHSFMLKNISLSADMSVFDSVGRLVFSGQILNGSVTLASALSKGVYFYSITTPEQKIFSGKLAIPE